MNIPLATLKKNRGKINLLLFFSLLFLTCAQLSTVRVAGANTNTEANANTSGTNTNLNTNTNVSTNTTANVNATGGGKVNAPARAPIPCPTPGAAPPASVTKVYKAGQTGVTDVQLGDTLTLEVANLQTLLDEARCATPEKTLLLYLDGRPVSEVSPYPPTDPAAGTLAFPLKRTEKSRETWTYLLGKPGWDAREVGVSVGLDDRWPIPSASKINLEVVPHKWFLFWLLIFAALVFIFWQLATKSDLLRDSGGQPGGGDRKPYSLARTQAAFWFFIVLASYLLIGIVTGDFNTTITSTVLGLIGISAGTVVGSAFVDAGKVAPADGTTAAAGGATNAAGAANATGATGVTGTANATGTTGATGAANTTNTAATTAYVPKNEYWWKDIISDPDGVSFHRFQMAAWTLVLGIIFISQVFKALAMPEFNGSLLALLGISAGTYIGLKIPEPTTPNTRSIKS